MTTDTRQAELPYPPNGVPAVASSDTSVAAATSMIPDLARLEGIVLACIVTSPTGLTDDELEVHTKLSHQTVSARRRTLVLKGLVEDSGERRSNRSGRKATIWVVAKEGASPPPASHRRRTRAELEASLKYAATKANAMHMLLSTLLQQHDKNGGVPLGWLSEARRLVDLYEEKPHASR